MKIITDLNDFFSKTKENFALTIGNFDGVHLGHQELIKNLVKTAKEKNLKTLLITFVPHPRSILNVDKKLYLLTTHKEREELLKKLEIDYLLEIHFSRDFSTLSPVEFLKKYLLFEKGHIKYLLLGHDFNFGAEKKGDFSFVHDFIAERNLDCLVEKFTAFKLEEHIVSSSLIRKFILEGNIEKATKLLGRNYFLSGHIIRCRGVGRQIGFPTANIQSPPDKIIPPNGVYCTKTNLKGLTYNSITNIGHNPTFGNFDEVKIETHILDFNQDIYGENIQVEFVKSIRHEKKFGSIQELVDQISQDKAFCQKFFS